MTDSTYSHAQMIISHFSLEHFEKSNETLSGVNALAAVRYEAINADFKKHIVMLLEMKKNLESVFKRIR